MNMPITKTEIEREFKTAKEQIRKVNGKALIKIEPEWEVYPAKWGLSLRVRYWYMDDMDGKPYQATHNTAM